MEVREAATLALAKRFESELRVALAKQFDKVARSKDGVWKVRNGYFYSVQGGKTVERNITWARETVALVAQRCGLEVEFELVDARDVWQAWPKDSWFEVNFRARIKGVTS